MRDDEQITHNSAEKTGKKRKPFSQEWREKMSMARKAYLARRINER